VGNTARTCTSITVLFIPGATLSARAGKTSQCRLRDSAAQNFPKFFLTGLACSLLSLIMPIAPDFLGREK
jgi:hypothetical protein